MVRRQDNEFTVVGEPASPVPPSGFSEYQIRVIHPNVGNRPI
jgi:hypothetical protein